MRAIGSKPVPGTPPAEQVVAPQKRADRPPGSPALSQPSSSEVTLDPRRPAGLSHALETAAAAPGLPPVSDLDRILVGLRATLEAGVQDVPEELATMAKSVLDDEIRRLAPLVDRRTSIVET